MRKVIGLQRLAAAVVVFLAVAQPAAAAAGAAAAPAPSPGESRTAGRFGIQLLEAPVNRRDDPRAYRHIVDHLPPGSVIRRQVGVANKSSEPLSVEVYPGAAAIHDGQFVGKTGRAHDELTEWTTVDHSTLKLPPGATAPVTVTIRVPRNAVSGERYGAVWAQVASKGKGTIKTVHRVGVRVYLSIGPGGEPPSGFTIDKITPGRTDKGLPQIKAQIRNTGRRALDMSGSLTMNEVKGPLRAGPFAARMGTALAPGQTAPVIVVLDERLDNGPWKVRLSLTSGRIKKTATADVTFPTASLWGLAVIPDAYQEPLGLGAAAAVILTVLASAALGYRRIRKHRRT
ncbi:peptidase [Streptomyces canus]|uniref:peptidase n=1 Tax=Streptomyces canus TaxID=58343 RepID=UPI0033F3F57D